MSMFGIWKEVHGKIACTDWKEVQDTFFWNIANSNQILLVRELDSTQKSPMQWKDEVCRNFGLFWVGFAHFVFIFSMKYIFPSKWAE